MGNHYDHHMTEFQEALDKILGQSGPKRPNGTGGTTQRYIAQDAVAYFLDRETGKFGPAPWRVLAQASLQFANAQFGGTELRDALVQHMAVINEWLADLDNKEN